MRTVNMTKTLLVTLLIAAPLAMLPFLGATQVHSAAPATKIPKPAPTQSESVAIKIYYDQACKNQTTGIKWGTLSVGASKSIILYVRNEGKTTVNLALTTTNWSPLNAADCIAVTWDYGGQKLYPANKLKITLTITTTNGASAITNFRHDTTIIATT